MAQRPQSRIERVGDDRKQDQHCDWVQGRKNVVWETVSIHLDRLRNEIVVDLQMTDPENRVECKNATCYEAALQVRHKLVVPVDRIRLALRPCSVHVEIVLRCTQHDSKCCG